MADDGEESTSQSMSPDSMDEERPLKKARYVWEIKGRYRWSNQRRRPCSHSSTAQHHCRTQQPARPSECPILRWQTRQMARAVVDNTINQVLEEMGFIPPPDDEEEVISFDFVPSSHNREGIENQAVLMAIQSHGLQKPCHCSHSPNVLPPATQTIPFHHRPSAPLSPEPPATLFTGPSTSDSGSTDSYFTEDILGEAISVAIQNKGLGSYSPSELG